MHFFLINPKVTHKATRHGILTPGTAADGCVAVHMSQCGASITHVSGAQERTIKAAKSLTAIGQSSEFYQNTI